MIRLHFSLGTDWTSRVIAWFSAGDFSHVDAILPDGSLLGSRSDAIGGKPPGVQIRPAGYEPWRAWAIVELAANPVQESAFHGFLLRQIGKPYDSRAIWGFITGRDWRAQDSWICSELQAAALEGSAVIPPLVLEANKITPAALALAVSAAGGKITSHYP